MTPVRDGVTEHERVPLSLTAWLDSREVRRAIDRALTLRVPEQCTCTDCQVTQVILNLKQAAEQ